MATDESQPRCTIQELPQVRARPCHWLVFPPAANRSITSAATVHEPFCRSTTAANGLPFLTRHVTDLLLLIYSSYGLCYLSTEYKFTQLELATKRPTPEENPEPCRVSTMVRPKIGCRQQFTSLVHTNHADSRPSWLSDHNYPESQYRTSQQLAITTK